MGKDEDSQRLIDDPQFSEAEEAYKSLEEALTQVLSARETTIRNLKKLKEEVEVSYDLSRKSLIGGTAGTVAGSALAITGFGLSFFTAGLSLGLTVAGTVLSAAGGTTVAGANIGYLVVSDHSLKHAKMAMETDQEMVEKAKELNDKLKKVVDSLVEKYPALTRDEVFAILCNCARYGKAYAKVLWTGYKLVDGVYDVGRTIATIAGGGASAAGRTTVWAGLNTAKQVANVAGAVMDVVSIPFDLFVMIKASIDVHKFKTTGESNSDVANKIGGFIKQLEEHRDELTKQYSVN